jgi:predicted RND superfamily exporter protein
MLTSFKKPTQQHYQQMLRHPRLVLVLTAFLCVIAAWQSTNFMFDASSDTLVVEGDPKLQDYLSMSDLFGGDEFLVMTYSPNKGSLVSDQSLKTLTSIQQQLENLDGVRQVFSILDAPLIKSPAIDFTAMATSFNTLRKPQTDKDLALIELTTSPLFREFLVSADGTSSAIRIDLKKAQKLEDARNLRDEYRFAYHSGTTASSLSTATLSSQALSSQASSSQASSTQTSLPTIIDKHQLQQAEAAHLAARKQYLADRNILIEAVRRIANAYQSDATIYISGIPMIAADMISFVKSDLALFGSLIFVCILTLLFFFFRKPRWIVLPILVSGISILLTMGILSFAQKPVTVVSSNFISLLAIICISFSIHLIVRYREILKGSPAISQVDLVEQTMRSKFAPCLYTALTTILAFGAMMGSRIVPVEDFGLMMCLGIIVSFFVTYSVFPSVLMLLPTGQISNTALKPIAATAVFSDIVKQRPKVVIGISAFIFAVSVFGVTKITFDNRFTDYFDSNTDIHKGMQYIDRHLGGTIPMDVYLKFEPFEPIDDEDDFFSDDDFPERYWFTLDMLDKIEALHDKIEQHPSTGKVISLHTLQAITIELNDGEPLNQTELAFVLGELPETVRQQILNPYAKPSEGIVRINTRISETGPRFSKDIMIADLQQYATSELELKQDSIVITGMMVLFNDMLKQLADSQLRTLAYVVLATFVMFSLLLRSLLLALLALIPNIIAATAVMAFMGFAGIPLDMMTITIAAISIGIGVDDAIHYLHRFNEEYRQSANIRTAIERAHQTIGRAMYFTSMIIMVGFSILAFSNFLPTVYFGLLTALAMLLALIANLTLLPALLVKLYR